MSAILYLEKFENTAGTISYTFPLDDLEYTAEQAYRAATAELAGADYAHDFAGSAPWVKGTGSESLSFTIWGSSASAAVTEFDAMVGKLRQIGRGKLFALLPDGSRRWAWAKLTGRPSYVEQPLSFYNVPVNVRFERFSDWYATTATTGTQAITASPTTLTITNAGNAPVRSIVFRLRANGAGGFDAPMLSNLTNGYSIASSRTAAGADDEIRIDSGAVRVEYSTTNGASYEDDYDSATLGATQIGLFRLEPGANSIRYTGTGTPALSLEWSFNAAYE